MRKALIQVLFWVLFLLSWQQVVYFYIDNIANRLLFTAFDVCQVMLVFYVTYYFITPRFFNRRKRWLFGISVLGAIVLAGLLLVYVMLFFLHRRIIPIHFNFTWNYHDLITNRYIVALLGALAGVIVKLSVEWFQTRRKMEESEKVRIAAELSYLKTQVNPHFLFNALNTVYIQIDESTEDAKHTLSSFADMLRYQLYECNQEKVPIEKEIAYLQHYVDLQKMRLDDRYLVDINFSKELQGFMIAPFMLLPLIENMFKHAAGDQAPVLLQASVQFEDNQLSFHSINSTTLAAQINTTGGIGLNNLQRRLALLYPNRHQLTIKENNSCYEVWLTLQPI